jgi:hypothetical protein
MLTEKNIKKSFKAVKQDTESIKDELAIALKRIAHLENRIIELKMQKQEKKVSNKKPTAKKKSKSKKTVSGKNWNEHLAATRKKYPKLTLKEAMQIASRTWKKEKAKQQKKKK